MRSAVFPRLRFYCRFEICYTYGHLEHFRLLFYDDYSNIAVYRSASCFKPACCLMSIPASLLSILTHDCRRWDQHWAPSKK